MATEHGMHRGVMARIAQGVLDANLQIPPSGLGPAVARRALIAARRALSGPDPLVRYTLGSFTLWLPSSHNLPYFQKGLPDYSMNIGRIAARVFRKYPDLRMIDIGANVGDTAAIVRSYASCPILCIEGDDRFFSILEINRPLIGADLHLERALVGDDSAGGAPLSLLSEGGTSRLVRNGSTGPGSRPLERLEAILERWPAFQRTHLLKIDTDGYDVSILRSSMGWIRAKKPILFFEFDPFLLGESGTHDPAGIFEELHAVGYRRALVHENVGDFVGALPLGDRSRVQDLVAYFSGRRGLRYMDVTAFPESDDDLCEDLRRAEIAHFAFQRSARP
jgi:FkbM family methyltransferase